MKNQRAANQAANTRNHNRDSEEEARKLRNQNRDSDEEVRKLKERLAVYEKLYEESQKTKDHPNDSDHDDDSEDLNDDSSSKRQSRSRSSSTIKDRISDTLIDKINKIPMECSLKTDGSNWDVWSDGVIRTMENKGCSPEIIEATTDPHLQYQLDSALYTLIKVQAGPELQQKIQTRCGEIRRKQGRTIWSELQLEFAKPPGLKNLQKTEAFHRCFQNILITH